MGENALLKFLSNMGWGKIFFSTFLAELGHFESFETMFFSSKFFSSFGQNFGNISYRKLEYYFLYNTVIVILKIQQTFHLIIHTFAMFT